MLGYGQQVGGTHPTGMHSYYFYYLFLLLFPRRFPEDGEELLHAIENAFDNLNAVGIPDVDLIDPHGDFSFSLWGVTSRFEFDRSWSQNEQGNHGNQTDWVQPPTFPGLTFLIESLYTLQEHQKFQSKYDTIKSFWRGL